MKVKELLEYLKDLDPELPIVLAKDAEGNGYDTAYDIHVVGYNDQEHEIMNLIEDYDKEDEDSPYSEEDYVDLEEDPSYVRAVVIWP